MTENEDEWKIYEQNEERICLYIREKVYFYSVENKWLL